MRFDTLSAWLSWMSRPGPRAIDLGLERVGEVWRRLGPPVPAAPVLTVAGTNGKGSSVAFAEAILQGAGYRTGCYTSPHLLHYNERIRIDGEPADDSEICAAFDRIDRARGDIHLTYFEFGTLAALCLFADARLDALVLEVGLGGRLDAVNLIDPDVALITAIGLDHQDWLGPDLESIGREKAGIMRPGRLAVFSGRAMPHSIADQARLLGARLLVAGIDYRVERRDLDWDLHGPGGSRCALPLPGMRGPVQVDNAAGVLVALDGLRQRLPLDQRAVRAGLLGARVRGRFEVHPGAPTWVLDVAHNPQAAAVLSDTLGQLFCRGRRIAVCAILADKDAGAVAQALAGRFDHWLLAGLEDSGRGQSAARLEARIRAYTGTAVVETCGPVPEAMNRAAAMAGDDDQVVVFGSFLTVSAAMDWLESKSHGAGG